MGFPLRALRDLQLRVRAEQQTLEWKARYAVRSGVEGRVDGFAHGHGMRRYRGQSKAHVQHVLAAISIERLAVSHRPRKHPLPPTDRLPELSRPARDLPAEILAHSGHLICASGKAGSPPQGADPHVCRPFAAVERSCLA
ncbi:transposase [Streptomyces hydrogenans]|uniref:transposase n=1 Tax=Streptomyces hydrogenans TaxID=1873719 RepID=UPI0035DE2A7A